MVLRLEVVLSVLAGSASEWKLFMIQFLNIAGLGPIFGAIMGAKFGTASYLWIVLGSIFAGATHDYFAGMLSVRNSVEVYWLTDFYETYI